MGLLFDMICSLVAAQRYIVSVHAAGQLDVRGIDEWQVASGLATGVLLAERPRTLPNPSVEVDQTLADGTDVKAIWSLMKASDVARLVTVHFYDG